MRGCRPGCRALPICQRRPDGTGGYRLHVERGVTTGPRTAAFPTEQRAGLCFASSGEIHNILLLLPVLEDIFPFLSMVLEPETLFLPRYKKWST